MMGWPRIGTAGWSIPSASAHLASSDGSHLQRYSRVFDCAEINSSFHRAHRPAVYAKWAALTPDQFRFAVKLPRTITHDLRLRRSRRLLEQFLGECGALGGKLGVLLVQLPPSLAFERRVATTFFTLLRGRFDGAVACEPRHASWLSPPAERLLIDSRIARVAADPAFAPELDQPGGWRRLLYLRLHGSPQTYWSSYEPERIERFAAMLRDSDATERWCVFDNTASGAAFRNACEMKNALEGTFTKERTTNAEIV
jgi:uncharacterized protein YecE (DUF72 family)